MTTGLEVNILRLLRTSGYVGAGTVTVPGPELATELESYRDAGAPTVGAGVGPGTAGVEDPAQLSWAEAAWDSELPPDLRRAAPGIYRSTRCEGQKSVREWLTAQYRGDRGSDQFQDLWQIVTLVDQSLGRERTVAGAFQTLATSDALATSLRRLAAYVHEARKGDREAARSMLAIRPPGSAKDLAPTWLVKDANEYSKTEAKIRERVNRGRGRGRGAQAAPAGADGAQDANKGRGRGGRRGGGRQ